MFLAKTIKAFHVLKQNIKQGYIYYISPPTPQIRFGNLSEGKLRKKYKIRENKGKVKRRRGKRRRKKGNKGKQKKKKREKRGKGAMPQHNWVGQWYAIM